MAGPTTCRKAGWTSLSRLNWNHQSSSMVLASTLSIAVVVRLTSALYQGDSVSALPGIYDQISYDLLARQVVAGHGFTFPTDWWPVTKAGEPTAHWSYLYTLYLSLVYALFGPHPLAARLIQAVAAGLLHPWLAWRIGHRLFGTPIGLASSILTAFYAYFVYYAGALMTETFYILAILWTLDLTTGMLQGRNTSSEEIYRPFIDMLRTAKPWLLLGLALGIAILLRQVFILFVPFLFAWILWLATKGRTLGQPALAIGRFRTAVIGLLGSTLVVVALVAPWTVHNYQSFGRFVLLNANAGYAFFWANHPVHGTDFVAILPNDTYHNLIPPDLRNLDEAALDQALLWRGVRFVVEDPVRYVRLSLSRFKDYFEFLPSSESGLVSSVVRVASFGILLPFMLLGLIVSAVRRRQYVLSGQSSAVVLLYAFITVYSLIHLLSWALIRYRLPVDAILLIFAALAITRLASQLTKGRLISS